MNVVKENTSYMYQKIDESDDNFKSLLVNIKNVVKQQQKFFTSSNKHVTDFKKKAELFDCRY